LPTPAKSNWSAVAPALAAFISSWTVARVGWRAPGAQRVHA
jgi:hypothetical protein